MKEPGARLREIIEVDVEADPAADEIRTGDIRFSRTGFQELLRYVWRGGYPRWRDGRRPSPVMEMRRAVERSAHSLLRGIRLEG